MRSILFLLFFIFININFAEAQERERFTVLNNSPMANSPPWRGFNRVKGIKDIDLKAIAVNKENPDIIYVGSKFIYRSEDGGESWQKVFTLPAMAEVNFLLVDGNAIYAATENGLFKSDDAGKNWQRIFKGRDEENNVFCLDLDKQNNLLYIGTQKGLFRSKDGKSWQRSKGKLGDAEIYRVKVDAEDSNTIYTVSDEGFFRTDNQGRNWKKTFVISKIAEEEAEEEEEPTDKLNDLAIAQNVLYLVGKDIFLRSKDKGETWQEMDKGVLRGADIRSIIVADGKIFLGTDRGIFRLQAASHTLQATGIKNEKQESKGEIEEGWEEIYAGLPSLDVRKIALAGDDLWAITEKGVFKRQKTEDRRQRTDKEIQKAEEIEEKKSLKEKIFELFAHEPSIREVQEKAIEYAEVHPDKIKRWRRLSAKRAILPKFSVGVDGAKNRTLSDSMWGTAGGASYGGKHYIGPDDKTVDDNLGWDVSLTWDLGDLIWSDAQTSIDVRSRLMVQLREDILDEVTRTYFERKRLKIELFLSPPKDEQRKIEKELRLEELTANLDALTGGWFSKNITDATDNQCNQGFYEKTISN